MRSFLIIFFIIAIGLFCVFPVHAQYLNPWSPIFLPFPPWIGMGQIGPYPAYPNYLGAVFLPMPVYSPLLIEPVVRISNAPVTLTIPTVTTTLPPLTAILNLLDPTLLASNITSFTSTYPLVYDLLIATYQLPI